MHGAGHLPFGGGLNFHVKTNFSSDFYGNLLVFGPRTGGGSNVEGDFRFQVNFADCSVMDRLCKAEILFSDLQKSVQN